MRPKRVKIPSPFTVYLLHIAHPVEPLHYVGITTPRRIQARMREHASGLGSLLTATACRLGLPFSLSETWETEDRRLEQQMIALRPKSSLCRVCRGERAIQSFLPTKMAGLAETGHQYVGLNFATQFQKAATTLIHEKGLDPEEETLSRFFGQT